MNEASSSMKLKFKLLCQLSLGTIAIVSLACSHAASEGKDPTSALLLKSGDQEPVMNAGLNQAEWATLAKKPDDHLDKTIGEIATSNLEEAEDSARNYVTKNPGDERGFEALATILYLRGRYEKSKFYANLLMAKHPGNSSAYNLAAISSLKTSGGPEDLVDVEKLLQKAFNGQGAEIAAGLNLGYLNLETGNSKNALVVFEETAKRCNNCFQAILGAGIAARRSKNFKESKKYLDRAAESKNPYAYYHLALWHMQSSNDYPEARETLVKLNDVARPGSLAQIKGSALFDQIVNVLQGKEN